MAMLLSHALLRIKLAFVRSKRQLLTSSYAHVERLVAMFTAGYNSRHTTTL